MLPSSTVTVRALLLMVLAGCAARQPAWRAYESHHQIEAASATLEMIPAGEPAQRYADDAPPVPADPALAAASKVVREAATRARRQPPVADGRLFAVARDMARFPGEGRPPYEAMEFSLWHHGVVEPTPHVYLFEAEDADTAGIVDHLRQQLPDIFAVAAPQRFGVAIEPLRPGTSSVALVLLDSFIELDPVPRALPRGGRFRMNARVHAPYTNAEVHLVAPDGAIRRAPFVREAGGLRTDLDCGHSAGRLKVEVVASEPSTGDRVLANFPVQCGTPVPRKLSLAPAAAAPTDAAEAERDLLELANRSRAEAGLAPLGHDERAAQVARGHSEEMRDGGWVAHISPTTGDMDDRARRAGLATPLLLENLARAYSAKEAHDGLMNSPGHRANLLNPQATHVGMGVALREGPGGRELYVTQLFIRKNPKLDLGVARAEVVRALVGARTAAGVPPSVADPDLDRIATAYATGLAAGADRGKLNEAMDKELDKIVARYSQVATATGITTDPSSAVRTQVLDPKARNFGLGIAQGRHPEIGEGAIYVVILMARPRAAP